MKTISKKLTLNLVATALLGVLSGMTNADTESRNLSSAGTGFPVHELTGEAAEVRQLDAVPAEELATFKIPYSNGRITFLDETPNAKDPTLSVVVVEDSGFNTLADLARTQSMTALDIFMAFANADATIPGRIQQDYDSRNGRVDNNRLGGKLILPAPYHRAVDLPDIREDNWANGCQDWNDWKTGFNTWVNDLFANRQHYDQEIGSGGNPSQWLGYFGNNDEIWLGVCMTSGTILKVSMQYQDNYGNWQPVGGATLPTEGLLGDGERYLYHSFKPYTAKRRVRINAIGSGQYEGGNWAYISGAWADNFSPDGEKASN